MEAAETDAEQRPGTVIGSRQLDNWVSVGLAVVGVGMHVAQPLYEYFT